MSKFILALLLIYIVRTSKAGIWDSDSPPQLYSNEDQGILPSNATDFEAILFKSDKVTVFQFYNSWCGHCRRYAPFFKEFGKLISNWSPVVQVAAINCVDESNEEICRNYSVTAYPTIRLFWTNVSSQNDTGKHVDNLEFSAEFLRDRTVEFIMENLKTKSPPASWPMLNKIKLNDSQQLKKQLSSTKPISTMDSNVQIVAMAEKNDSYVGQQIILELSNYRDKIQVLSLEIPETNSLNFTVDTATKTALLQFEPNSSNLRTLATLPLTEKNQTAYYVNYIDQNLFDNKLRKNATSSQTPSSLIDASQIPANQSHQTSPRTNVQSEDVPLGLNDLYGAISYTLYHQIPLKKKVNGSQLNILKRFFDIIERYFPADDPKFSEFIKNLNQFLRTKEQELDINDFLNHLKKNDFDFKAKFKGWETCKGSEPKYRGYTCSLWSLFHTLTLNEYLKEKDTQKWINLHEVLFTMRDYIGNFFSCTDCAQHFTSMAQNLENELKQPNSSVLWLWRAHNRVNKRLKGDLTEDPEHPKNSYPYQKDCPQCYMSNGEFNENEVWNYLINRYGLLNGDNKKNEQPKLLEDVPQNDKLSFDSNPDSNNRVFNFTDYSLMFGLYVCIVCVMALFFYLPLRIKRKAKIMNSRTNSKYLDV